jgi:hypothetical protein
LQTAKPENIFLQRGQFPKAYVEEYLATQENLSLGNVLRTQFAPQNPTHCKLIYYSRSSSHLESLGTLQNQDLLREIDVGSDKTHFLNLSSIDPQFMCMKRIIEYQDSKKPFWLEKPRISWIVMVHTSP